MGQDISRIPTLVDTSFDERGAKRIAERGEGNAASADSLRSLSVGGETLGGFAQDSDSGLPSVEIKNVCEGTTRAAELRQSDAALGSVVENRLLTLPDNGKRDISPATSRDIRTLLSTDLSDNTRKSLETLQNSHAELVVAPRLSLLDILEEHRDIKLPFGSFLAMLPSMRVRQYSISSSPLWNASNVTLTVSVLQADPISAKGPFLGVASNFLANLRPGDKTPLVLFAAGSGLAPMRGFLQERALQKKGGRDVGEALLFFGCRNPKEDFLYSDSDLKEWEELGVVKVRPAFSRASAESLGCKYVQDRVWNDREDISKFYDQGARYYVCGSSKVLELLRRRLPRSFRR
ncbi:hypothetical protein BC629DRAFT_1590402 [Irpex lacteus]|nr:hypothetical protein BC629DRAFT_1590402 [Irpex lacteus]